jgi:3-oxoacyl-[acyl-carrier-protein] synthase II
MGLVSPVGTGVEYAWQNIIAGRSGIRPIDKFDASNLPSQIAGVPILGTGAGECDLDGVADKKEQARNDLVTLYALAAADQAIKDSGFAGIENKDRIGVSVGSGIGGMQTIYDNCTGLDHEGPRGVSPFFIPKGISNMPAGQISIKHGLRGPNITIVTACATGTHSIGEGARLIQHGDADIMVCGGSEAAVCGIGMAGFCSMKALSSHFNDNPAAASRPWDRGRDGFVIGEGAAVLVLEEYEHAVSRGAKIYAEVIGYGMSGDAHHITAPAPGGEGGLRAMQNALRDAGIEPSAVDYVNAHGTSTGLGDAGEYNAVKTLFGGAGIAMSSTKSMTGHMLGAAGAAEAVFCVLAMRDGIVPPTINLENPDEFVDGSIELPTVATKKEVNVCVNNSFGFGGTNASLVLRAVK